MSLQLRKTTLVGKLMKLSAKLLNAELESKQTVKSGYADNGATRVVSLAIKVLSRKEQTQTLSRKGEGMN